MASRILRGFVGLVLILALPAMAGATGQGESTAAASGPVRLKIFQQFTTDFKPENNAVIQYIEKKLNLSLEFEIPPLQSYGERQRIVIASGQYPDVMSFGSNPYDPVLLDAVDNGVAKNVTKWLKAAPSIQRYTNPVSWDAVELKGDGQYYAIPGCTVVRADGYIIRQDWLDKVGLSLTGDNSVTLDQFTEIMKRLTKNDPDGNGQADTYGFTAAASGGMLFNLIAGPFDVTSNASQDWWLKTDKGPYPYMPLMYSKVHDNMKRALEYNKMLWGNGYIDPNWPTNNSNTRNERFFTGKAGMRDSFGGHVYTTWLPQIQANNPKATATYITGIRNEKGELRGAGFGLGVLYINTVLNAGKEEAAVRYFDFMLSDDGFNLLKFGIEGLHYNVANGKKVFTDEYVKNYAWRTYLAIARRYNDPSFFIEQMTPQDQMDIMMKWINTDIAALVFSADRGYRASVMSDQTFIDYRTVVNQTISKIITGQLPVSEWDKVLDGWYKAGGERYLKEVNDFIAKTAKK